jgi:hypothetical protein
MSLLVKDSEWTWYDSVYRYLKQILRERTDILNDNMWSCEGLWLTKVFRMMFGTTVILERWLKLLWTIFQTNITVYTLSRWWLRTSEKIPDNFRKKKWSKLVLKSLSKTLMSRMIDYDSWMISDYPPGKGFYSVSTHLNMLASMFEYKSVSVVEVSWMWAGKHLCFVKLLQHGFFSA